MSEAAQMQYIPLDDLEYGRTRYIRENVVEDIKDRIETDGYNPARPLRVISEDGHYVVADGNHRLETLNELRDESHRVPCVVEEDGDLYEIARKSNRDEDTYAPEDLFDHLYKIDELREEHSQAQIAEKMEWSRSKVAQYVSLLNNVVTEILDMARQHQEGRVTGDVTNVTTHNFTEGWFRTSGLYDLQHETGDTPTGEMSVTGGIPAVVSVDADVRKPTNTWKVDEEDEPKVPQQRFMDWFVHDKNCNAGKQKVGKKVDALAEIQDQLTILEAELIEEVEAGPYNTLRQAVIRNEYTEDSLRDAIEAANKGAKDQAYFGVDSVEKLQEFEDNKIACVVTDPPYGVDYENFRDSGRPSFGEDAPSALETLRNVFEELQRVCKANAHLYVFFPTKLHGEVRDIAAEYFDVEEVPLVWVKNNIAPTQDAEEGFKKMYAQQYETLFHLRADKGDDRELNGDSSPNVLEYDIPKDEERWHDSQKPIGLWEEVITNSTGTGETIMDPFAGSGSSLLAAKNTGRHYIGLEKSEDYESRFKKELRKIEDGGDSNE